ncbi:MAG: FAD-binding protein, partial [Jannaschia sp.]
MRPETEDHLAEIIRGANAPLSVRGGATRHLPGSGEALTTTGLSGITLYEPGALTMVVRAGTPMADVEAALAAENQRLPFEPMDHRALLETRGAPTIGGAVAMNVSGPRRVSAGACRDSLIGVRFVDGTGMIVKNGGRVMKNVTGYDLVKLLAGSKGTLGVLSEVSLKVLPAAATQATLRLGGLSVEEGVRALAAGLSSPFEVTGAAHDTDAGSTLLRIEGLEGSVDYRAGELARVLS